MGAVAGDHGAVCPEEEGGLNEAFAAPTRAIVSIVRVQAVAPFGSAEDAAESNPLLPCWPVLGCRCARDGKLRCGVDVTYESSQHAGIAGAETEPRAILREGLDQGGLSCRERDARDVVRGRRRRGGACPRAQAKSAWWELAGARVSHCRSGRDGP